MQIFKPAIVALVAFFALSACSVNVKKNQEGNDKNVDIKTPFGEIHVDKGADVKDTGLPVYAGARLKPSTGDNDEKSANVNISSFGYGVRVVAVSYESDDPPSKLVTFYKEQLKRFGTVLECHTADHKWGPHSGNDRDSEELKCDGDNNGKTIELKAGKKSNQHIVAIDPKDKGADFALVYVRLRGKEDTI
ncbi:MAG TPA: hypothetical protein VN708_16030 [Terriglobales bacterium]|jgi:hypothetical protein|nr:hypothetical protein [Terriglobales bacterium]